MIHEVFQQPKRCQEFKRWGIQLQILFFSFSKMKSIENFIIISTTRKTAAIKITTSGKSFWGRLNCVFYITNLKKFKLLTTGCLILLCFFLECSCDETTEYFDLCWRSLYGQGFNILISILTFQKNILLSILLGPRTSNVKICFYKSSLKIFGRFRSPLVFW